MGFILTTGLFQSYPAQPVLGRSGQERLTAVILKRWLNLLGRVATAPSFAQAIFLIRNEILRLRRVRTIRPGIVWRI